MFATDPWSTPISGRLLPLDEATHRLATAADALGAQRIDLGSSRAGRPIQMVRIGDGDSRSLWYGGPHSNEPVGIATIVDLAERLAAQPALVPDGHGFDLVLCIDPDGYLENEAWFGPGNEILPGPYYEHLYRSSADEWPDWDLPVAWTSQAGTEHRREAGLPETRALMAALELSRPRVLMALHNGEVGEAYYHLTGDAHAVAPRLSGLPGRFGIPLASSPIDMPGLAPLAPGVFPLPDVAALYGPLLDAQTEDPLAVLPHGESAAAWASRQFGTVTLVPEIPYWTVRQEPPAEGLTVGEVAVETGSRIVAWADHLTGFLTRHERWFDRECGRARAVADSPTILSGLGDNLLAWGGTEDAATAATAEDVNKYRVMLGLCLLQRYRGMLLGAMVRVGAPDEVVAEARADVATGAQELARIEFTAHPVSSIMSVQLASGLTAIETLAQV